MTECVALDSKIKRALDSLTEAERIILQVKAETLSMNEVEYMKHLIELDREINFSIH